ncbi:restriction endonuclease subunit S [Bradyrhizobium sp. WSM2254]|uniref:restriction endonuclease subunit S n=1 Tax=Bradyrhizobium sp. WSM2254 TaxID=1188263 RepID=UPI0004253477|nr:restriction endonuclease subunit S [Bradyrhizobium sp. WSM2254]
MHNQWPLIPLYKLVQSERKITYGIVQPGDFVSDGVPLVRGGDYSTSWAPLSAIKRVRPEIDAPYKRSRLRAGDLVVTIVGAKTGNVACVPDYLDGANITQTTARVAINEKTADPNYIIQYFKSDIGQREVYRYVKGGAQPGLNLSDLELFKVPMPPLPEQARIAEILHAWDDATDRASRLIEVKNRFIRGKLAECVSDAREAVKKDGWERTTIGEVATLIQQRVKWDEEATYRLITVKRGCGGLVFRGDRKGHEILTKDMYTVRAGDFLISKRQVVHGAWAMVPPEFDGGHVSKEYACLRSKPNKLWMPYFDWLSRTERLQHEAFICSYGVDIEKMVLNVEWLLQTPLLLPPSIDTQKAMATGLDCLQQEVELLQAQMEALRRQKRGLMQKLLTGEWRVPVRDGEVDAMAARVTEEAAQ